MEDRDFESGIVGGEVFGEVSYSDGVAAIIPGDVNELPPKGLSRVKRRRASQGF